MQDKKLYNIKIRKYLFNKYKFDAYFANKLSVYDICQLLNISRIYIFILALKPL